MKFPAVGVAGVWMK